MKQELVKFCFENGVLLDRETLELLSDFEDETAKEVIRKISLLKEKVITKSFFNQNVDKIREVIGDEKIIEKLKISFGMTVEISREIIKEDKRIREKQFDNLRVAFSHANLSRKIEPADFVKHFRNRYNEMKKFLQERKELENLSSIGKIGNSKQSFSIIGIVFKKRITANKNVILEVEDLTGKISVLVSKDKKELYEKAKEILVDDILGLKVSGNREIVYANELYYPDMMLHEKNFLEREEHVAFISDVHVGSKNFLEKNFLKFVDWLNGDVGDETQRAEARKIKYLFITGDTVDGVGVFPGQEDQLLIKDVKLQYEKLAEILGRIRKDVRIIHCPGQHDAVRIAEPQPSVGEYYAEPLHRLENIIMVSNPALIEIMNEGKKGVKILMYHGASMNAFVNEIESLRVGRAHHHPSKVVKQILKRRHFSPLHSAVVYIPTEVQDPLLIREVPDIITTADFHRTDIDSYNNILIICCSCWQSITPFEEKVGNIPDPCKVPVLNLKTRAIKIMDFSDSEEKDQTRFNVAGIKPEQGKEEGELKIP